jgi:hypothetical protein
MVREKGEKKREGDMKRWTTQEEEEEEEREQGRGQVMNEVG